MSYFVELGTATIHHRIDGRGGAGGLVATEVFQQAEGVATLLEALGMEGVRRSLYGDNKSALALYQGDVGTCLRAVCESDRHERGQKSSPHPGEDDGSEAKRTPR